jgi:type IV pilus assembly protein PilE
LAFKKSLQKRLRSGALGRWRGGQAALAAFREGLQNRLCVPQRKRRHAGLQIFSQPSRQVGWTLLELLIVLVIVAVLASLAYPAYTSALLKSKRAEGRTALLALLLQQERYMTQNNTYLAFSNNAGVTSPPNVAFITYSGAALHTAAYDLSAGVCAAEVAINVCVRVLATPRQPDSQAGSLYLESTGAKGCSGQDPAVCW